MISVEGRKIDFFFNRRFPSDPAFNKIVCYGEVSSSTFILVFILSNKYRIYIERLIQH